MPFDWWTFALQAINFLILAWLLQHFLYQPVMRVVAARRAESDKLMADAEAGRQRAQELEAALRTWIMEACENAASSLCVECVVKMIASCSRGLPLAMP